VVNSLSHDVILIVIIGYVNLVESHDVSPLYLFYVLDMMCSFDDIAGIHQ
jgi:hypothetical protein